MANLSKFWEALEQTVGHNVFRNEWERILGETYPEIQRLFLKKVPWNDDLKSRLNVRVLRFLYEHPPGGGDWMDSIKADLLRPDWHLLGWDWKFICKLIARAFTLDSKYAEVNVQSTRQVAELSDLLILLTIQPGDDAFHLAVAQLVAMLDQPFVLLAPTRRFYNVKISELLSRRNAAFFDLETHLRLLPNGSLQADKSGGELFSQYLPEQREALSESEAVKLFALMKSLNSEPSIRKATLEQVIQFLVLDNMTQAKAAVACKCSEATISARVKEIEKRMGKPIEQLRGIASRRYAMDSPEKVSRAKNLYRKGLVDDTKPEG